MNYLKRLPSFFYLIFACGCAQADLVIVTHPNTAVTSITSTQLERLYFGMSSRLPDGTVATVFDVDGENKSLFYSKVLKKTPEQVSKYWTRMLFTGKAQPPRAVKSDELKAALLRQPGSLGYMDSSKLDGSLKVITLAPGK